MDCIITERGKKCFNINLKDFVYSKIETDSLLNLINFEKICRICFSEKDLLSICNTDVNGLEVYSLLKELIELKEMDNSDLPQNICCLCLQEIYKFHYFKNSSIKHEALLLNLLKDKQLQMLDLKEENHLVSDDHLSTQIDEVSEETINIEFHNDNEDEDSCDAPKPELNTKDTEEAKNRGKRRIRRQTLKLSKNNRVNRCPVCLETFRTHKALRKHREEENHLKKKGPYKCNFCEKILQNQGKLKVHLRVHTKEKPYKCNECDQRFTLSGNLKRHQMRHTGERPHVCDICGQGFIQATSLQRHTQTHVTKESTKKQQTFTCEICGRFFKRLGRYKEHIKKHNSGNSETDKNIDAVSKTDEEEVRKHACEICKRMFKTKHMLKAHILRHGERSYLCSHCGKGFTTKAGLQSHSRTHTGEKPYECSVCKKAFAHVTGYDTHVLIHTGVKPHKCDFCNKSFTQIPHLKYHLRTHSGERPYSCSYCGKTFALKGNLTVHIRTHTGETPFVCPVCSKGFYDSSSMKKHQRSHGLGVTRDIPEKKPKVESQQEPSFVNMFPLIPM